MTTDDAAIKDMVLGRKDTGHGRLNSWSSSKLNEFQKCKYRTFLLHVEKVPEPERPLPPGKTEHANDRGSRIHQASEDYVSGTKGAGVIREMGKFTAEFEKLRALYKEGKVKLEGEWGFDQNWGVTDWRTAWVRMKLDAMVFLSKTEGVAIDYKSGRLFGNEVKHAEQLQLYQFGAFMRYPQLEVVHTELWYLDVDELTRMSFTRSQGIRFGDKFTKRGMDLTTTTDWPANPNIHSCRWCQYGPWGSGHCTVGKR